MKSVLRITTTLAVLVFATQALAAPGAANPVSANAASLPPMDASINPALPNKTLVPKVVVNSGRLEWVEHIRDLTPWVTLSSLDKRSGSRPKKVTLTQPLNGDVVRGKQLASERCMVCHQLPGDDWPGTLGAPLMRYGLYRHDDADVYQQIYDARIFNPDTVMPPYGTHGLLSEQDIRDLVAYLQITR